MSEDPSPPVLRLKPRLRPEVQPPAVSPPPVPPAVAPAPSAPAVALTAEEPASMPDAPLPDEPLSLKLRPLGTPVPEVPRGPISFAPASSVPAAEPPSAPAPEPHEAEAAPLPPLVASAPQPEPVAFTAPPPPAPAAPSSIDATDASRFRLKPRTTASGAAPSIPIGAAAAISPLPPPPTSGAPVASIPPPPLKPTSSLPPPASVVPAGLPPLANPKAAATRSGKSAGKTRPENSTAFKTSLWVMGAVMMVTLSVGGFLAFRALIVKEKQHTPATTAPAKPAPAVTAAPAAADSTSAADTTHEAAPSAPQSLPGKMVAKARETVAAHDASGQVTGVIDLTRDDSSSASNSRTGTSKSHPGTASPTTAHNSSDIAASEETAGPPPSPEFRAYVANLRVNGVFQGDPGRALINGRMVRVGEVADRALGIRFARLDAGRKILFFQDEAGSTMQRRY